MPARTPTRISDSAPIDNRPWPLCCMRLWREFAGLSLEEMSEQLKRLGIKRKRNADHLDRMERGLEPYHQSIIDGYAAVLDCFYVEILYLPPASGSIYAWYEALTSAQRQTVRIMLSGIEYRASRQAGEPHNGQPAGPGARPGNKVVMAADRNGAARRPTSRKGLPNKPGNHAKKRK